MSDENKNNKALTDEEVSEASGGAGFKKCPKGHWEATSKFNGCLGDWRYCDANYIYLGYDESKGHTYKVTCPYFGYTKEFYTYSKV